MFWTDHQQPTSHIGRANMDGSDQRDIITDAVWPNGLALDYGSMFVL